MKQGNYVKWERSNKTKRSQFAYFKIKLLLNHNIACD
jgi:hypothetical protein